MKHLVLPAIVSIMGSASSAQDAPDFFSSTYPEYALAEAMEWYGTLNGADAPLDPKTRELVMLGVAAQIPCNYCVYAHRRSASAAGATEAEIRAAVALAGAVRMWSTVLHGMEYDFEAFAFEHDKIRGAGN